MNKIRRSKIEATQGAKTSFVRTQSNAWLYNKDYPNLNKISKYFDTVSQLSISNTFSDQYMIESEPYQIGLYSPGGVFLPHMDTLKTQENFINSKKDYIGNRIATLMLYLSDVDGGGTAFTKINKLVYPKKGSSVFWFNLYSDGKEDTLTIHGACPTMYGIKWGRNFVIRVVTHVHSNK
ncbi:prolyl 4-hydroxylase subunit alpha-1 isoform X2 [Lepeophtheirus salmonis]|uniref:prolyl 4-hydroxylase subunit alpha-1 isoform X2 n=1 Tax=Lepeophtheirus salmonis TaxID=72036 RepID=UPI003AF3D3C0